MKVLAIETSCDETALAILEIDEENFSLKNPDIKVLKTALYSQVEKHREYGGVYPSLAKREHARNLVPLLESLITEQSNVEVQENKLEEIKEMLSREPEMYDKFVVMISKTPKPDFDMIAVTSGPGLEPALWVGINFAKALSLYWDIPVMPINHMEGHIVSVLNKSNALASIEFPAIALLISGGHTELVLVKNWGAYEIIGATKDDAVGEAFDKVARLLGLSYPGGPEISRLASEIRQDINKKNNEKVREGKFKLPRPMINTKDYDFSFSGLKTAVLYLIKNIRNENNLAGNVTLPKNIQQEIAFEFENAVTEVLYKKTSEALKQYDAKTLIIGGGVINNKHIREKFTDLTEKDIAVLLPDTELTTDNAVMIGIAGFLKYIANPKTATINPDIRANGGLKLS